MLLKRLFVGSGITLLSLFGNHQLAKHQYSDGKRIPNWRLYTLGIIPQLSNYNKYFDYIENSNINLVNYYESYSPIEFREYNITEKEEINNYIKYVKQVINNIYTFPTSPIGYIWDSQVNAQVDFDENNDLECYYDIQEIGVKICITLITNKYYKN